MNSTKTTPTASPTRAQSSARRRGLWRRVGGAVVASGALAFGGVSAVPSGLAEAAGIHGGRLQHVATTPETPTTTTTTALRTYDPNRRETLRVHVGADGDVTVL